MQQTTQHLACWQQTARCNTRFQEWGSVSTMFLHPRAPENIHISSTQHCITMEVVNGYC